MNSTRKLLSIVLSIAIILSFYVCDPVISNAQNSTYTAEYSGYYSSSTTFKFSISSINKDNNTFNGHICIEHPLVTIDKDVSGQISLYDTYYKCSFMFSYFWLITNYSTYFDVTVYPHTGVAIGSGGGGLLVNGSDFELNGTINKFYNSNISYCEDDMKLCMNFSKEMYSSNKEANIEENLSTTASIYNITASKINVYNYTNDEDQDNVAFAILSKNNSTNNSIDLIVAIRGTYNDEWQGNIQITGENYNSEEVLHNNFNKAKDSIKDHIVEYYNTYCANSNYDTVNLIITGHLMAPFPSFILNGF